MKITAIAVENFRGISKVVLDDLGGLVALVGRNSSGKSAILEGIDLMFQNLAVAAGNSSGVDEYYFHDRNSGDPALFSIKIELAPEEVGQTMPSKLQQVLTSLLDRTPNEVTISRSMNLSGQWQTRLISWGEFSFVSLDVVMQASEFKEQFDAKSTEVVSTTGRAVQFDEVTDQEINQALTQLIEAIRGRFALVSAIRDTINPTAGRDVVLSSGVEQNIQQLQQSLQKDDEETYVRLERLYRELTGLRIDPVQGRVNVRRGSSRLPLFLEGGGLQEACNMLYSLVTLQRDRHIIALEEPETHMHPELQRRFFRVIRKLARDSQVFLVTHSPVFLSQLPPADTWLIRFAEGEVTAGRVTDFSPVLSELGVLPSDVLFANRVVFVEGPSDKIFLEAAARLLSIDFRDVVIVSMEGKGNVVSVVKQWQDGTHGLVKLFVILDADSSRKAEELVSQTTLKRKDIHVWKRGEIEDYYPDELIGEAFETVNQDYMLEMDLESLLEKVRSKSVKAAAIDLGKKRPALQDRWKVILARAVGEAIESLEGKLDREIRDVLKKLVSF